MGEVDCIEIEADEQSLFKSVYKKILLKFSSTSFGQYAIKHVEHALWTVEKTAKWSLPGNCETNKHSKSNTKESENKDRISEPQLVRPLPWILFLFTIIILRLIRLYLSIIALLIGRNAVTPQVMVCFLQKRRRRLRALKFQGQRMIRIRKIMEKKKEANNSFLNINLLSIIFSIIKPVLCTNPYYVESDRSMEIEDVENIEDDKQSTNKKQRRSDRNQHNSKKRTIDEVITSDSESNDDNCSVNKLLEKYANDSSDSSFKIDYETYSESSYTEDSETEDALNKSLENEQEDNQHENAESEQMRKSPEQRHDSPAPQTAQHSDPPKAIVTAKEKKSRKKALKKQRSDEQKITASAAVNNFSHQQKLQPHHKPVQNPYYSHDTHHHNHHNPHYHPHYQHPQQQRYYFNHKHQHSTLQKKRSTSPERNNTLDQHHKSDDSHTENNSEIPNNDTNHSNDDQNSNNVENGSSYENGNYTNNVNNDQDTQYKNNTSNDNNHDENVNIIINNIKEKQPKHGSWSDDIYYSPIGSPIPTNNGNENGNYDDNSQQNDVSEKSESENKYGNYYYYRQSGASIIYQQIGSAYDTNKIHRRQNMNIKQFFTAYNRVNGKKY